MQVVINQAGASISRTAGAFEIKNREGRHKLSLDKVDSILISRGGTH